MNRQLEVGKTYRAVNGARVTVTGTDPDHDYLATVTNDERFTEDRPGRDIHYKPDGTCYGLPRLNVDWENTPDTDKTPDIIVLVEGGCVQSVKANRGDLHVYVLDLDDVKVIDPDIAKELAFREEMKEAYDALPYHVW